MMLQDVEREMYMECVPKEKQTEDAYRIYYGGKLPSEIVNQTSNEVATLSDADIARIADAVIEKIGTQRQTGAQGVQTQQTGTQGVQNTGQEPDIQEPDIQEPVNITE